MNKKTQAKKNGFFQIPLIVLGLSFGLMAASPTVMEKRVDVGPCMLNFKWIEGNDVTILFESGGGWDSGEWDGIIGKVAERTGATVMSYDRAGFGKSDLPKEPCRMDMEVAWLFKGLETLGRDKDLILVGHSYGGWMIHLIAGTHPDRVIGLVYVDPFSVEFVDQFGIEYIDKHPMCGNLPFDTSDPEKLTPYQKGLVRMVGDGMKSKVKVMRSVVLSDRIPGRLLSSRKPFLPKPEETKAWWKSHEMMAEKYRNIRLIPAENSDHGIPQQQPDLVIDTIAELYGTADKKG